MLSYHQTLNILLSPLIFNLQLIVPDIRFPGLNKMFSVRCLVIIIKNTENLGLIFEFR
jgi:hypothetical protein